MSRLPWIMLVLVAATLVAAACGGDDKPAYCSNVSDLQQSVDDLKSVHLSESGALSTLQTDVQKVQSDADAVVNSAKEDFPDETSALKSSVSSLSTTIEELPSSPTAQQLAALAPEISSVVTAAKDLDSATSSACDDQAELPLVEKKRRGASTRPSRTAPGLARRRAFAPGLQLVGDVHGRGGEWGGECQPDHSEQAAGADGDDEYHERVEA